MEWQAKRLTPRIQIPKECVNEKMQELLQKYAWINEYAMYEIIINDLAEYFHVSKETVKYHLMELGYSDTRELLNYINEAYIPAYKIPSKISPYQILILHLMSCYACEKQIRICVIYFPQAIFFIVKDISV